MIAPSRHRVTRVYRIATGFLSVVHLTGQNTNYEESIMRFACISTAAALTVLLGVSVGQAQNNQSSPPPPANNKQTYETIWPTPAQEVSIPYRPCEIAIGWEHRRLICRNP